MKLGNNILRFKLDRSYLTSMEIWVVVSNIFYFHPFVGKIPILTHIFQMGWFNHQLEIFIDDYCQQLFRESIESILCFSPFPRFASLISESHHKSLHYFLTRPGTYFLGRHRGIRAKFDSHDLRGQKIHILHRRWMSSSLMLARNQRHHHKIRFWKNYTENWR